MGDPKLGLSAAVRLVRLADVAALCVPAELTDAHVARLRLVELAPQRWALGLADAKDEHRLRAPALISADGDVTLVGDGVEEELALLYLSRDADVFPHLVILPHRVSLVGDELVTAIVLATCENVRFDLGNERGFSYVALLLTGWAKVVEVARYRWDPYELTFMGPAIDKLPDPPGGKFELDLEASRRLEPVGGEIPAPSPAPEPVPAGNEWT